MVDNKKLIILCVVAGLTLFFLGNKSVSEAEKIRTACETLEQKESCYGKAFASLTTRSNMEQAFQVLHQLQQVDPETRGCHFIAHSISTAETQKDPSRWKEIMLMAPQECSYGAAHGALEVHAASQPDGKLAKSEVLTICPDPDQKNCTHILGHLLLVMNENEINSSLTTCEALPHGERGVFECLTGVFMERITAFNLATHGLADQRALNWVSRIPELETLCKTQSGTRAVACWKEIAHAVTVKYSGNMQEVVRYCEKAPLERATKECIDHSIGIIAGTQNFDFGRTRQICEAEAQAPDFKERCYPHLVTSTLSTLPREIDRARDFCHSLEAQYLAGCLKMVGNFENGSSATIKVSD